MLNATYIARMQQISGGRKGLPVDWDVTAKRILKAELARAGVTYKVLALRLEGMGIEDSEAAIANRISRGKFSFSFFLQCMAAVGVVEVDLRDRSR